jgi:hypothetical protein
MAIVNLNTIKNWFKTSLKPTQQQFWDTWDSFRHKSEKVPIAEVEGINELLQAKASKEVLETHLTDENAHSALFAKINIVPNGKFTIYKNSLNTNPNAALTLEAKDVACGFIPDTQIFIPFGMYLSGDISDVENNWNTSPMDFSSSPFN